MYQKITLLLKVKPKINLIGQLAHWKRDGERELKEKIWTFLFTCHISREGIWSDEAKFDDHLFVTFAQCFYSLTETGTSKSKGEKRKWLHCLWLVSFNYPLQDVISSSLNCLLYNSSNVIFENFVLNQLIISQLIFIIINTCLTDILLVLLWEMLSWSLMGA